MTCKGFDIMKARPLRLAVLFFLAAILGGCASSLKPAYYSDLRDKIDSGDYKSAAEFVEKSKKRYGKKNILLFYLDSGFANHLAGNYGKSIENFENAKSKFEEYYQKSVSAGAASMFFNDSTMPYYGENFEEAHIRVFESLNYILSGDGAEAAVEARQSDRVFVKFAAQSGNKNFYKDDGFIRYFMGLVYENSGELNDAHISYYLALKAYKDGISEIAPPKDLINDAYSTALLLGMSERAAEIKAEFPFARAGGIPSSSGELVIICYNGFMPKKVSNVLEFALFNIWPYVNQVEVDNEKEAEEFNRARSAAVSFFADDYVKVAFPKYEKIPNDIAYFSVETNGKTGNSYMAQDLARIAQKCLDDNISKIRAKALARAAVKYVIGKTVSKAVADNTNNSGWGLLTQAAFNVYNSLSETADTRGWNVLPENILMARLYLPEGENEIVLNFLDRTGNKIKSEKVTVSIEKGKKNFMFARGVL
ncbi:MAG: hypothetical protein LBR69_00985 [Endomicrobium sp.]|jgi:hypothetical protein|nr:hypothetical protein [Endomicrobium sp.]